MENVLRKTIEDKIASLEIDDESKEIIAIELEKAISVKIMHHEIDYYTEMDKAIHE